MTQIKARFAGNGDPLSRTAKLPRPAIAPDLRPCRPRPSWVILDVPNPLKYKDRPKRAPAWAALSKLVVDELQRRLDALPRKRTLRLCVA